VRLLLDTNVLFAAFLSHGVCAGLYEEALLHTELIVSEEILSELGEKLVSKGKLTRGEAAEVIGAVRSDTEVVGAVSLDQPVCRDPDDDMVLGSALAGRADVIVTGDKDLLVLKTFRKIPILTPRECLSLF
jgi:putative PIN family toxin of toxin-antitoxin system